MSMFFVIREWYGWLLCGCLCVVISYGLRWMDFMRSSFGFGSCDWWFGIGSGRLCGWFLGILMISSSLWFFGMLVFWVCWCLVLGLMFLWCVVLVLRLGCCWCCWWICRILFGFWSLVIGLFCVSGLGCWFVFLGWVCCLFVWKWCCFGWLLYRYSVSWLVLVLLDFCWDLDIFWEWFWYWMKWVYW